MISANAEAEDGRELLETIWGRSKNYRGDWRVRGDMRYSNSFGVVELASERYQRDSNHRQPQISPKQDLQ